MKIHLRVVEGPDSGRAFSFDARDRFVIGRAPTAHFQIRDDPFFSRHHLMLEVDPPNVLLQDLKSRNGTHVNGAKVQAPVALAHGDQLSGGKTRIQLILEEDAVAPTQGPAPRDDKVAVRCLRCDAPAANELPRTRAESMAYFCDACQRALLDEPRLVPGYQVVKELGRGGMGAVYLAVHEVLRRRHAIKMILPRAAISQRVRDMFLREAAAQAALDHPRIVRVHDFQETSRGIFCLVMDYVDGKNAEQLLEASPGGLEPRLAAQIVAQGLEGLAHAHARGIVHRDIKDANLLVGRDAQGGLDVKLSDFGLAKSYETTGASGFTRSGDVSGTMPYMPPEQILDFKNVRPPADLYSMGATLYHLLTNECAYNFRREMDPLVTILEEDIVPIARRRSTVPAAIAAVAERALRKDPAQRYASAAEMRAALIAAAS
ncbi:MAG: protein kinase [Deltaproteobacteria bacterium]|nr:protein kinase [Deltaproteobacteria bacterium]